MADPIVPTVVQKTYLHSTGATGTPMRLIKYTFKATKAAQSDYIVCATYFQSGTPLYWNACTIDSSSNGVQEGTTGMTYLNNGTNIVLASATVGTSYGEIWFEA